MMRLAVGGSAEKFALRPDIVMLGKFLGGGTALGAFGGSRDIMKIFDPTQPGCVFHGGSFNGNLIGCAAGLVAMRDLTAERIAGMDAAILAIRAALARSADQVGIEVILSGIGSVAGIAFAADPKRHEDNPSELGLASLFHLACLQRRRADRPRRHSHGIDRARCRRDILCDYRPVRGWKNAELLDSPK